MRNLSVSKKFIVSFGTILVLFFVSVFGAGIGLVKAKASYDAFYTNEYKTIATVYEMRIQLQRAAKELLMGAVASDSQDISGQGSVGDNHVTQIYWEVQ